MKNRARLHSIVLIACCGAFSLAQALSPKPKNDPLANQASQTDVGMPTSQEATEQSVLPEEPLLSTPTPEPSPETGSLQLQPLPTGDILKPSGPTVDEQRKLTEAFRAAKTEAEEDLTFADIKTRAFAAPTEREKRALLREYYRAIEGYIIKKSPTLKDNAQLWSYAQQNRLARNRTEPDYVAPTKPDAVLKALAAAGTTATPTPTPEEKRDFLPSLGN